MMTMMGRAEEGTGLATNQAAATPALVADLSQECSEAAKLGGMQPVASGLQQNCGGEGAYQVTSSRTLSGPPVVLTAETATQLCICGTLLSCVLDSVPRASTSQ